MRRKIKKSKINYRHFRNRLYKHYQLSIDKHAYKQLSQLIQNRNSNFICKQSQSRSVHEVLYQGQKINVVYDKNQSNLVTVLPPGAKIYRKKFKQYHGKWVG